MKVWTLEPLGSIVPLAAGGSVDTVARMIATRFTDKFGQQFIVDNRPGAGGIVAAELVAKAEALVA